LAEPIKVEGLRETVRSLERFGLEASEPKQAMHKIGELVASRARQLAPRLTGTLAGTIKAGRAKAKATVRAGSARAPYAGPIHWGWPARNIAAQPFLVDALEQEHDNIIRLLESEMTRLIRKLDLD